MGIESYKFSKVSSKVMVNKCVVTNCSASYKTGQKKALFHFHEDQELKRKWIVLPVAKVGYLTLIQSCVSYFEEKMIKRGKKCQLLYCGKYIQYLQS